MQDSYYLHATLLGVCCEGAQLFTKEYILLEFVRKMEARKKKMEGRMIIVKISKCEYSPTAN